jgi:murein DD-endopeptidase MepM/ murein hydrolase activator NlpD
MRSNLFAFVLVIVITLAVAAGAAPAAAAGDEEDFVMEAFPHPTADVDFWDSWGARRSGGRPHRGTDIMSPRGSPVVAVADGEIIIKKWHHLSGWYLGIEHEGGWETYYVHLNNDTLGTDDGEGGEETAFAAGIEIGVFVEAGQVIGYVGDSGNAEGTQPHTHFSLRRDGTRVNPFPYLEEAWQRQLSEFAKAGLVR